MQAEAFVLKCRMNTHLTDMEKIIKESQDSCYSCSPEMDTLQDIIDQMKKLDGCF